MLKALGVIRKWWSLFSGLINALIRQGWCHFSKNFESRKEVMESFFLALITLKVGRK